MAHPDLQTLSDDTLRALARDIRVNRLRGLLAGLVLGAATPVAAVIVFAAGRTAYANSVLAFLAGMFAGCVMMLTGHITGIMVARDSR